jgi:hypothetical protein
MARNAPEMTPADHEVRHIHNLFHGPLGGSMMATLAHLTGSLTRDTLCDHGIMESHWLPWMLNMPSPVYMRGIIMMPQLKCIMHQPSALLESVIQSFNTIWCD